MVQDFNTNEAGRGRAKLYGVSSISAEGEYSKLYRPPLRSGPMFGGIAGIMNQEQGDADDIGHLPTMPTRFGRDTGDHHEIYRKTLAAGWSSQDLPADECIEDIFAGGDGWGGFKGLPNLISDSSTNDTSDTEHLRVPGVTKKGTRRADGEHNSSGDKSQSHGSESGQVTPENPTPSSSSDGRPTRPPRRRNEVSELDVREDLRSWDIGAPHD